MKPFISEKNAPHAPLCLTNLAKRKNPKSLPTGEREANILKTSVYKVPIPSWLNSKRKNASGNNGLSDCRSGFWNRSRLFPLDMGEIWLLAQPFCKRSKGFSDYCWLDNFRSRSSDETNEISRSMIGKKGKIFRGVFFLRSVRPRFSAMEVVFYSRRCHFGVALYFGGLLKGPWCWIGSHRKQLWFTIRGDDAAWGWIGGSPLQIPPYVILLMRFCFIFTSLPIYSHKSYHKFYPVIFVSHSSTHMKIIMIWLDCCTIIFWISSHWWASHPISHHVSYDSLWTCTLHLISLITKDSQSSNQISSSATYLYLYCLVIFLFGTLALDLL